MLPLAADPASTPNVDWAGIAALVAVPVSLLIALLRGVVIARLPDRIKEANALIAELPVASPHRAMIEGERDELLVHYATRLNRPSLLLPWAYLVAGLLAITAGTIFRESLAPIMYVAINIGGLLYEVLAVVSLFVLTRYTQRTEQKLRQRIKDSTASVESDPGT